MTLSNSLMVLAICGLGIELLGGGIMLYNSIVHGISPNWGDVGIFGGGLFILVLASGLSVYV